MRMTVTSPAIELENISLELESDAGKVNILRGIDLSIPAGITASIMGPSGSGKTTLLMILSGLERPTGGRVRLAGRDITGLSEDELAFFRRDHVGIVFQNFHLIPTMTALENVAIPLELAGRRDAFTAATRTLESLGLGPRLRHYPGQMSGGEQQRVAIARAFAANPAIILADEPTGNLDGENGRKVMDILFAQARKRGATLLLVTHDPELAGRCDRHIRLKDGKIAA